LQALATVGSRANQIATFSDNEHWRRRTTEESIHCGTVMLVP
jgi:hypothetical protein